MNGTHLAFGATALLGALSLFKKRGSASGRDVAYAWSQGEAACAGNLITDGNRLLSYQLPIGITHHGKKVAIRHDAQCDAFYSRTTSKHVSYARQYAEETHCPPWPPPSIRDIVSRRKR